MTTSSTPAALAPVRRIVTGHTSDGKAVVAADDPVPSYPFRGSTTHFTDLFWQEGFPADNSSNGLSRAVTTHDTEIVNAKGSLLRAVDMPPHTESVFHRVNTIDYGVLISGSLVLVLDDNKRVLMKPGDVIVQRGTIHAWVNDTDEWTRMYFVLIPANKVEAGGKELEVEFKPLPAQWKASSS
ncbi:cupin domain-containing protein [Phanerochaete sordida]|uniref:Cupin domain-containing protein n=1 Tax=Phanerochaete sordida TaxID=48140 RepID=A0A9P3LB55_9APHY|nr:cupin domain-containing protein [Phanerochaete sordida]